MDPLAHTLTGACLAKAGLDRTTPLATTTLILAANLPDVEAVCYLMGSDLAYGFRRGWTHGLLAVVLLPGLLGWAMLAFDRHVRRRWRPQAPPALAWPILAAAMVGVISHLAMDWLNSYGVRLLMPFENQWFYGDALFIVDPWLWLLLGAGVVLAWTQRRWAAIASAAAALGVLIMLAGSPQASTSAAWAWAVGLLIVAPLRWIIPARFARRTAQVAMGLAVVYVGSMIAVSRMAERDVRDLARVRGWDVDRVAAIPVLAEPLRRKVVAVTPTDYLVLDVNWPRASSPAEPQRITRGVYNALVASALDSPTVRGVRAWLRFPSIEVQPTKGGGQRVVIRDARFMVGNRPGFGVVAIVNFDARLKRMPEPGR
jgi:inner membrane protein